MADASTKEATTNITPKSCVAVNCDCNTMWSLAQQFSSTRLCIETGEEQGKLVRDYSVRARRIAATYARFYLEIEVGGDIKKLGRYYWMALGAFASKTVACTFEAWQVETMSLVTKTVWEGLGKGNFWLFCDISGWHWYHNMYPASFEKCMAQRNAQNYARDVKAQIAKLPWNDTALRTIRYFAPSAEIKKAFAKIKEFDEEIEPKLKKNAQFQHLLEVAKHEQGVILQPLIYDDRAFAGWVQKQRAWYAEWASPALELVFTHQCSNKHLEVKSVAPKGMKLENFLSRMEWINGAADKFHRLMQEKPSFMHSALSNIAAWVDLPDRNEKNSTERWPAHEF
ncbi:MAG: hypothetical protein JWQ01_2956 [Massilia sp.]|jgi:hypothetical protein|nr:hypothetical protein [Massilia sp.]